MLITLNSAGASSNNKITAFNSVVRVRQQTLVHSYFYLVYGVLDMKISTQKYWNKSNRSRLSTFPHIVKIFISSLALLFLTGTASANDISPGKYSGRWNDSFESWSGRFILDIETVTNNSIAGTIRFTNANRCSRTDAFKTSYSGQNHLSFRIKTESPCQYFHVILDYDNGMFSGTYKDHLGSGKLTKVKPK